MHRSRNNYTLTEIILVILIATIVMGLVLPRLTKTPSGPFVRKVLADVQRPFDEAGMRARAMGHAVVLELNLADRSLVLRDAVVAKGSEMPAADIARPHRQDLHTASEVVREYTLDQEVKWTSATEDKATNRRLVFVFYGNGEAAGPSFSFACRRRTFRLSIDPLTGAVMHDET